MSKSALTLPTAPADPGEVNIVFAVKIGEGLVEYVGPIEEELAKGMLALLGKRIFAQPAEEPLARVA